MIARDRSPGMRMKRGSATGSMTSSRTGGARPFRISKISEKPRLGMNGKGCAGSIACGVSSGKICSRKCLSSQASAGGVERLVADHHHARRGERVAQIVPHLLLVGDQPVGLGGDRGQLLAGRQPVGRPLLDAERLVRLEPGDADHEEFVEVAGRDRQEAQPLEQRMGGVARFLEHAAVERQPAQLAIEIARLSRRGGGRNGRLRRPSHRSSVGASWRAPCLGGDGGMGQGCHGSATYSCDHEAIGLVPGLASGPTGWRSMVAKKTKKEKKEKKSAKKAGKLIGVTAKAGKAARARQAPQSPAIRPSPRSWPPPWSVPPRRCATRRKRGRWPMPAATELEALGKEAADKGVRAVGAGVGSRAEEHGDARPGAGGKAAKPVAKRKPRRQRKPATKRKPAAKPKAAATKRKAPAAKRKAPTKKA